MLRPVKEIKERTPVSSSYPGRLSFDGERGESIASIEGAPEDHRTAKKTSESLAVTRLIVGSR